jgi:hypothetical protein
MALANFNNLKDAILTEFSRNDSGFVDALHDFILRGESVLNRRLRTHQMRATATVTISSSASTASLPTGFLSDIGLHYTSDLSQLTPATDADLVYWGSTDSGQPRLYRVGATVYEFDRPADQSYATKAVYYKANNLTSDSTNWLLTNYPDAYLYASCFEAAAARQAKDRMALYKPLRDEIIEEINRLNSKTQGRVRMRHDASLARENQFNVNTGNYL